MKVISILLCLVITNSDSLNAQKKITGNYYNYFGSRIEIYDDSTFKYSFHFDLESSWTIGRWKVSKDTIYFTMTPVYDTVVYRDSLKTLRIDSLILSIDEISGRINSSEAVIGFLSSGGQNRHQYPDKLFYKRNKLFSVINDKLSKNKIKGFWTQKNYVPWYIKDKKKD